MDDGGQVDLILRITLSQRRSVWGPPLVMLHFLDRRRSILIPSPIGEVTLFRPEFHGFCLFPIGFEIVP